MDFLSLLPAAFLGALIVQLVAFTYALRSRRADIIDVAWGLSFIAAMALMQLLHPSTSPWVIITDLLVTIWGARLSWHIYRRFKRSDVQDERYTEIIRQWPKRFMGLQLFARLFLLQAILATTISLPVIVVHTYQPGTSWLTLIGLAIWIVGFIFESVADRQLKEFLATPNHAALMTNGLWRYSRHPNYFGEVSMWWGIALIAAQTPLWWLGLIGAVAITLLISFVSGIPIAEKRSAGKEGWTAYKRQTSALLPWPPKK